MTGVNYTVVSPVRNEAKYLPFTIASMASQTIPPQKWVLVDDGSEDGTGGIAEKAAAEHKWIEVVHRRDRGFRQAGGGVVDAFYDGYDRIAQGGWDYLVKLDGDLTFESNYFESCFKHFQNEPRLGVGGGLICGMRNGSLQPESTVDPAFHVRGASKIYRRECWQGLGGLVRAPGWDTLDEVKANMLGWETRTFSEIRVLHHRPAGGAYGTWPNYVKNGLANYIAGYHPLFMLVKCARRALVKPYGIQALGLLTGFFGGYLKRVPQVPDPGLIRYFRQQQMNRLLRRPSLWDSHPKVGACPCGSVQA